MVGIAYTGPNGNFAPNVPYIIDGFETYDETVKSGLLCAVLRIAHNITPFYYPGPDHPDTPEIISWDYVEDHKLGNH